jgi:hypothetical protein
MSHSAEIHLESIFFTKIGIDIEIDNAAAKGRAERGSFGSLDDRGKRRAGEKISIHSINNKSRFPEIERAISGGLISIYFPRRGGILV